MDTYEARRAVFLEFFDKNTRIKIIKRSLWSYSNESKRKIPRTSYAIYVLAEIKLRQIKTRIRELRSLIDSYYQLPKSLE